MSARPRKIPRLVDETPPPSPPSSCRLPDHLVSEFILARLPAKSIVRFKSVCRAWKTGLSDPYFVESHLLHSKTRPRTLLSVFSGHESPVMNTFIYDEATAKLTFFYNKRLPSSAATTAFSPPIHCNGLLLIATSTEMSVCNPATWETLTLPKGSPSDLPGSSVEHVGFCFDSKEKRHKVVRPFYMIDSDEEDQDEDATFTSAIEVLTLGYDEWVPVLDTPPYPIVADLSPAIVGAVVYWLAEGWDYVVGFDVEEARFIVIDYPPFPTTRWVLLLEMEERLCFFTMSFDEKTAEIWMMSEDGGRSGSPEWKKILGVNLEVLSANLGRRIGELVPVKMSREKFLFRTNSELCCYDTKGESFLICKMEADFTIAAEGMIDNYFESLIEIKQRS